jgi:MFS family permease
MLRGYEDQANNVAKEIEDKVSRGNAASLPPLEGKKLKIIVRDHTPFKEIFRNMLGDNRKRSFLALTLMVGQAFFFNAVFFTYALVVKKFFHVSNDDLPKYLLPFAVGSFLGPMVLGPLFDKIGRKPMITATYGAAGLLLLGTIYPFAHGNLGARGLGICFTVIFFVASSAASAAYLTVSEIFPLEIRAFAIAVFYSLGTLVGGVGAPLLFGFLIASGSRDRVGVGYLIGGILMLAGAVCEYFIGVEAAGKSLETVSSPLQSAK